MACAILFIIETNTWWISVTTVIELDIGYFVQWYKTIPSNRYISDTLVDNKIADHSNVFGASPRGAARSHYILILDLTHGCNALDKDNCKTRRETLKSWDLVPLILKVWRFILWSYISELYPNSAFLTSDEAPARCIEIDGYAIFYTYSTMITTQIIVFLFGLEWAQQQGSTLKSTWLYNLSYAWHSL